MSGTTPPETNINASNDTNDANNNKRINNNNEQEWWMPSVPRWPFKSWTEIFTSGPRNDLIGILANKVVDGMHKNLDPDGPVIQKLLDEHLPTDSESVRTKLPFYESTVDLLKYQRDNYLLGNSYANKKQVYRDLAKQLFPRFGVVGAASAAGSPKMPHDATALGYIQIAKLGSWFVPSETIKEALLPIVISLPSGALKGTITSIVANAIPLAQPPLDNAMKNAVMGVIRDPQIRQMIKSRTQKILRSKDDDAEEDAELERIGD
jgi:hypothetical protein